ncbi:MAG: potassium/proton antiporter [Candidatus Gastranaerophilales bacterium]|nr:potassium/proton antiporter [Candidatus Gastranaerophilales bacterium]
MSILILFCAIVIFSCIITNKFSSKLGMPSLVFFMFLGVLFGSDGILKISFDDYDLTSKLCSIGLLFIIFYGGFCTKKISDVKVNAQAILLSSFGTVLTAGFCTIFCYFVLKLSFIESFLIGSVISSTDAASVFSILRSRRLNLKYNTASLLEMESGSNDPFAYILTILGITMLKGSSTVSTIPLLFKQIFFGLLLGVLIAYGALFLLKKTKLLTEGTDTIFIVAVALLSFSVADLIQGNGYLSVYITGIILGNSQIKNKLNLMHFFDGITALCQVIIFFLIGFLSFPHKIPEIILPAILITLFLTFVARPFAVFLTLLPFKIKWNQFFFISSAGLRGAASIVFAILVVSESSNLVYDLFHIVFVVALLSVSIQGSLLPFIAKKANMIDKFTDVRKTFNDFQQESAIALNTVVIGRTHPWAGQCIKDIHFNGKALILTITRDGKRIVPKGITQILENDEILIGSTHTESDVDISLCETFIDKNHEWLDFEIKDISLPENHLIALIKRGEEYFVPNGTTKIQLNDTIVFYNV